MQESELSLHACLSIAQPLERWRLDLALPASHGKRYPGSNPALVRMPAHLSAAFPAGKWLVAWMQRKMTGGDEMKFLLRFGVDGLHG